MLTRLFTVTVLVLSAVSPALRGLAVDDRGIALPAGAISRCGNTHLRPATWLPNAAISADGELVASTCSEKGKINLWRSASGRMVRSLTVFKQTGDILDLELSPDGRRLAVVVGKYGNSKDDSESATVGVWDVRTGRPLFNATHPTEQLAFSTMRVAFSPDGRTLAYSVQDGRVEIRELDGRKTTSTLKVGLDRVPTAIRFSADSGRLTAGGIDWVRIWKVRTGKLMLSADGVYQVSAAARERNQKLRGFQATRAALLADDEIRWTWRNHVTKQVSRFTYTPPPQTSISQSIFRGINVVSSTDLSRVAFWSDQVVRVRQTSDGKVIREIKRDYNVGSAVTFSPDGTQIALETAAYANAIRLINVNTGALQGVFQGHSTMARDISFSADGNRLLATTESRIYIWDVKTRKLLPYLDGHEVVTKVAFSPDGRYVASEGLDQVIDRGGGKELPLPTAGDGVRVWDTRTGKQRFNFGPTHGLLFTPDSKMILNWKTDGSVRVRELETGKIVQAVKLKKWDGKSPKTGFGAFGVEIPLASEVSHVSTDNTGNIITYLIGGRQLVFFDRARKSSRFLPPINMHDDYSPALLSSSLSTDGSKVLCIEYVDKEGFGSGESRFVIFDAKTGNRKITYNSKQMDVRTAIFSADAKLVAALCEPNSDPEGLLQVHFVDTRTGKLLRKIAIADPGDLLIFRMVLEVPIALSPDGALMASGGNKDKVRLWDVKSGKLLHEIGGHAGPVTALAFSQDGRMLASGSLDTTVLVWNLETIRNSKAIRNP